jgi:hypothetical protein
VDFHDAWLDANIFEDLPGKWQPAISKAEQNRPKPPCGNARSSPSTPVAGRGGTRLLRGRSLGVTCPSRICSGKGDSRSPTASRALLFSRKRAATFSYSPGGFPVATNGLAGPTLVLEALILWLKCGEANDVEPEGTGLGVSGIG